ncbi:hypothetical protein BRD01_15540 [Halobacteriales archaeon QS_8_65_32]|nr:MAG: hypothetical protein BRD01_15540 [Halobacteriales archaeon QS_8_65_32]
MVRKTPAASFVQCGTSDPARNQNASRSDNITRELRSLERPRYKRSAPPTSRSATAGDASTAGATGGSNEEHSEPPGPSGRGLSDRSVLPSCPSL